MKSNKGDGLAQNNFQVGGNMVKGKKFSNIIGIIFMSLGFAMIFGFIFFDNYWPRYIVLQPPVPKNVFVISEEKTIYIPYSGNKAQENAKSWVWRRKYDFLPLGDNLYTTESILAYFDKWLNEQGWQKFEEEGFPCGDMIEADFLTRGKNLFAYIPKDAKKSYYSSAVCVAVWPYTTADKSTGFNVLLYSTTP